MKTSRISGLDGLRGIAALSVVFYHYFYRIDEIYNFESGSVDWLHYGQYGVHLFFMISGFVIFMSLDKITNPLDFLISRFTRLYPVYFFAVTTTFCVVYIFGLEGREVNISEAILNLLMFHEYLNIPHVDGVYWTLTVEITFYFWCFTLLLMNKIRYLKFIMFAFLLFSFLSDFMPEPYYKALGKVFFTNFVAFFLLGILTFSYKKDTSSLENLGLILLVFIVLFIKNYSFDIWIYIIIYGVFLAGVFDMSNILKFRFFVFAGEISYSLYLIHQNVGYVLIKEMMSLGISRVASVFIAFIFSVTIAKILHKYIEVDLSKRIKNILTKDSRHYG